MSCVLRVSGEDFDVDAFLRISTLEPYAVYRRGEPAERKGPHSTSGMKFAASDNEGKLAAQAGEVVVFLTENEPELRRLSVFPGVTDFRLDFGHYCRDAAAQYDYLPPELIARAGSIGLGIELSLYHTCDELE